MKNLRVILGLLFLVALLLSVGCVFSSDDLASDAIETCHNGIDKVKSIDFDIDGDAPNMHLKRGGVHFRSFPIDEDWFKIPSERILYYLY